MHAQVLDTVILVPRLGGAIIVVSRGCQFIKALWFSPDCIHESDQSFRHVWNHFISAFSVRHSVTIEVLPASFEQNSFIQKGVLKVRPLGRIFAQ